MQLVSLPFLAAVSFLATSVAAKTASLHSDRGCKGDSKMIPWSQCIPTFGNKSIEVPDSEYPDQVLFDCYLYSMEQDTTCQEDRRKATQCTDNLYYYSKCVFVPAPGFVSLYYKPNFEEAAEKINITRTQTCMPLSFPQLNSVLVADGYTCNVWSDPNCHSERVTVESPGNANRDLSFIKSINCSETPSSSGQIRYDL
ncbi:hypothetical protein BDV28DRAFT_141266 [Aspergillus coremiiformis]|uniref:Uncharacterized protein n=1 Tax=Aspergillus coremiiformis TaxID=138285 RepID=A0A5N6YVB3_9EURO|nr:hypothetical protein BDV28DRAFT_141266 [Aspergillus coremiiformis]